MPKLIKSKEPSQKESSLKNKNSTEKVTKTSFWKTKKGKLWGLVMAGVILLGVGAAAGFYALAKQTPEERMLEGLKRIQQSENIIIEYSAIAPGMNMNLDIAANSSQTKLDFSTKIEGYDLSLQAINEGQDIYIKLSDTTLLDQYAYYYGFDRPDELVDQWYKLSESELDQLLGEDAASASCEVDSIGRSQEDVQVLSEVFSEYQIFEVINLTEKATVNGEQVDKVELDLSSRRTLYKFLTKVQKEMPSLKDLSECGFDLDLAETYAGRTSPFAQAGRVRAFVYLDKADIVRFEMTFGGQLDMEIRFDVDLEEPVEIDLPKNAKTYNDLKLIVDEIEASIGSYEYAYPEYQEYEEYDDPGVNPGNLQTIGDIFSI